MLSQHFFDPLVDPDERKEDLLYRRQRLIRHQNEDGLDRSKAIGEIDACLTVIEQQKQERQQKEFDRLRNAEQRLKSNTALLRPDLIAAVVSRDGRDAIQCSVCQGLIVTTWNDHLIGAHPQFVDVRGLRLARDRIDQERARKDREDKEKAERDARLIEERKWAAGYRPPAAPDPHVVPRKNIWG